MLNLFLLAVPEVYAQELQVKVNVTHSQIEGTEASVFENLQHTIEICPRIALMEDGKIIRDIDNKAGSALQELEEYFA